MSVAQMRPTFVLRAPQSVAEVMQCVRLGFADRSPGYECQFTSRHVIVSLRPPERHFWSPWMNLEIREVDNASEVFGRFSPHPSIWTAFMFSYLGIAVLVFFASMFGVSQQLAGQSPWAYFMIPGGLLVAAGLWFASKAGQRLAMAEMQQMRAVIEECVPSGCKQMDSETI